MADIELVIKMPEEYYNVIKAIPDRQCDADMLIIKGGTPLPKMGRWIVNEWGNISCSECGCTALYDKVYQGESVFGKAVRVKSTFCPTCGAKMQEGEEEE